MGRLTVGHHDEAMYLDAESYMRLYQWHPERLVSCDALARAIFDDFVKETIKNRG